MSYGKCPKCGANGISRERRPNGNDTCENGHTYPSKDAVVDKKPLTISTEDLMELITGSEVEGMKLIEKVFIDTRRWSINYRVIVKIEGRFGMTYYDEPATEMQETDPFPCPGDEQALIEMEAFEETVTEYRRKE